MAGGVGELGEFPGGGVFLADPVAVLVDLLVQRAAAIGFLNAGDGVGFGDELNSAHLSVFFS